MKGLPRLLAVPEAAVTKPLARITAAVPEVLLPGQRLVSDLADAALDTSSISVPAPPPRPQPEVLSLSFFVDELRAAIDKWEVAANDAVGEAIDILSAVPQEKFNYPAFIGSVLEISGAITSPVAPIAGAAISSVGIILQNVRQESAQVSGIDDMRETFRDTVEAVGDGLTEGIDLLAANLLASSKTFKLTKLQAQEDVLLKVFTPDVLRKSQAGIVGINQTALRAKITFNMLLDFAELGIESDEFITILEPVPGGELVPTQFVPVPHVSWVESYSVKPTKTEQQDGSQVLKPPSDWLYDLKKSTLRVVGLPKYKDRVKSFMRRLGNNLELSRRSVPLFADFVIEDFGTTGREERNYQTRTDLWTPPSRLEVEGVSTTSEGILGPEFITVLQETGDSVTLPAVISAYAESQSRYSFLRLGFPSPKLEGAILLREAWKGPFPTRTYEQL